MNNELGFKEIDPRELSPEAKATLVGLETVHPEAVSRAFVTVVEEGILFVIITELVGKQVCMVSASMSTLEGDLMRVPDCFLSHLCDLSGYDLIEWECSNPGVRHFTNPGQMSDSYKYN